jgi:transposase-like protein
VTEVPRPASTFTCPACEREAIVSLALINRYGWRCPSCGRGTWWKRDGFRVDGIEVEEWKRRQARAVAQFALELETHDLVHIDPCRLCRGMYRRADMITASALLPGAKRGWVCKRCFERRTRLRV